MAKVLVIDDEPSIATLVAEVIEGYGHEVTIAYNGKQGLELARYGIFELIISDVMMPYLNGRDLLKIVRSDPKLSETKFVLMSAVSHLTGPDHETAPDAFIVKPFDITTVDKVVNNFLADGELQAPDGEVQMDGDYGINYQISAPSPFSRSKREYLSYGEQQ
ncbi:MAG TPA: response regulator [Chloroflexia bacterium]|nr:response regulator [Chloroflexia bacterium]